MSKSPLTLLLNGDGESVYYLRLCVKIKRYNWIHACHTEDAKSPLPVIVMGPAGTALSPGSSAVDCNSLSQHITGHEIIQNPEATCCLLLPCQASVRDKVAGKGPLQWMGLGLCFSILFTAPNLRAHPSSSDQRKHSYTHLDTYALGAHRTPGTLLCVRASAVNKLIVCSPYLPEERADGQQGNKRIQGHFQSAGGRGIRVSSGVSQVGGLF